jgi:hypothetical protein
MISRSFVIALLLLTAPLLAAEVTLRRLPDKGLEPQVAVDSHGTIHLIYFTGVAKAGDIVYRKSSDGGATFSDAMRVNSEPDSACIIGAVRGPRLAIDSSDRPHVIWCGSDRAQPTPRLLGMPLLYARLADPVGSTPASPAADAKKGDTSVPPAASAFSPQRQIIASGAGVDGGPAIAPDHGGNVDIIWHAPSKRFGNEQDRRLYAVSSRDDFATRSQLEMPNIGVCACCAVEALYDEHNIRRVLFRGADQVVHRDNYLLTEAAPPRKLAAWNVGKCVMSTADAKRDLLTWESQDYIMISNLADTHHARLGAKNPKHPRLAIAGERVLVAWTENTAWEKGGRVHWQLLDKDLKPLSGLAGKADDLPAWDYPAPFATPDGSFVIYY